MNVLLLLPGYPSEAQPAAYVFHRTACEALCRSGVAVRVVAPVAYVPSGLGWLSARWAQYAAIPRNGRMNGVLFERPRYVQVPRGDIFGWSHRWFVRILRKALRDEDRLIHAHFAYPCGLAAVRVARERRVPCALTLHGSDVNRFPFTSTANLKRFREAVLGADEVIAVSEALAVKTEQLAGRRPSVLPVGVDLRRFSRPAGRAEMRQRLGLNTGRFLVLFVGYLYAAKGIRELLEALGRLAAQDVVGVFVGEGPLWEEIRACPHATAVGPRPNEEIAYYLAAADVLVLPSYSEGMPTVLIEAGAAGTPVVATAVGGIPELLAGDRGIIIQPQSVDAIVEGILAVKADVRAAEARAGRLRAHIEQEYDADRNARRQAEIYARLLSSPSAKRDVPPGVREA